MCFYTEVQLNVIQEARDILAKEYGYTKGVCVDTLPSDRVIKQDREEAVGMLVMDTCLWANLGPFELAESIDEQEEVVEN